jgi:hypothetical protein
MYYLCFLKKQDTQVWMTRNAIAIVLYPNFIQGLDLANSDDFHERNSAVGEKCCRKTIL